MPDLDLYYLNDLLEMTSDMLFLWVAQMVMEQELMGKLQFSKGSDSETFCFRCYYNISLTLTSITRMTFWRQLVTSSSYGWPGW